MSAASRGDTLASGPAGLLDPGQRIVLIEDDAGDATLVREMLAEVEPGVTLEWARSIAEAKPMLTAATGCVLLDLQLPDAVEFSGLDTVLAAAPGAAVVVLTGFADQRRGIAALARGAQDYLSKAQIEPDLLARAIRYALERRTADDTTRELAQAQARAAENTRLERGLLPVPLISTGDVAFQARYRPGRDRALLGGDFYDVVEIADGSIYALIGDVCGHGPDEAALGVCLRVAWRTLVLAGTADDEILPTVARVLIAERPSEEIFATACMLRIAPDRRSARVHLAGHPAPLVLAQPRPDHVAGPPLGVVPDLSWTSTDLALPPRWCVALYTDGLIEGRATPGGGGDLLGTDGLQDLLDDLDAASTPPADWADPLIERVIALNGGALTDDLALLILSDQGLR